MKPGAVVVYEDAFGAQRPATVLAVVGTGASGYKTLDLTVDGATVSGVPHAQDRIEGGACWRQVDEGSEVATASPAAEVVDAVEVSDDADAHTAQFVAQDGE